MKLKEFLSLFRTMPGGVSSLNIKNLRDDVKVHVCSDPNSTPSDKEESRSNRRCRTFFDKFNRDPGSRGKRRI